MAGGHEHFGEVAERVALKVKASVRSQIATASRELAGLAVVAPVRVDERLHLPPERLRHGVLLVAQLAADLGERLGLVVASQHAE